MNRGTKRTSRNEDEQEERRRGAGTKVTSRNEEEEQERRGGAGTKKNRRNEDEQGAAPSEGPASILGMGCSTWDIDVPHGGRTNC
ncbi:hypothetical protein ACOMHN_029476 [Nucella lapillus]